MALQLTINKVVFGQVVTINNAYHRIEKVEGNKDNVHFVLNTYTRDLEHLVESDVYQFVPDGADNALRWDKQGYEYLKKLDKYSDGTDV